MVLFYNKFALLSISFQDLALYFSWTVTEASGTRAWGESIPPTPPNMGIFFGGEVFASFDREAVNWDLAVSLGKGILQEINHKPVGEGLGPPENKG